ncbi:MAG: hypothetical protein ACR2QU_11415 [Gammaproteobacteria bacterium]
MTDLNYPECIRELYESEIFGEALTLALLEVAKNERDCYHHGTLLQLETETQARLRPLLYKYGISLSKDMDLASVPEIVAAYQNASWQDYVGGTIPIVKQFLERFEEIASAGPEEDQEYLQSMIRHETAILRWMEMEAAGDTEGSLDAVIGELRYPLPTGGG